MKHKQNKVVAKVQQDTLNLLRVTGCAYIVLTPDGERYEHDPGRRFQPKRKQRGASGFEHGALSKHYVALIHDMVPGDVRVVPALGFPITSVQSGICSRGCDWWGKGSVVTVTDKENNSVEVLRVK